jgi:NAD-dependent SIR2 family protein deacetylase
MNMIPDFVEYLSAARPLILLGAGVSAASGMPGWSGLDNPTQSTL